jgi:hypothetical protein
VRVRRQWGLPDSQVIELRREEMQRWWRYQRALGGGAPPDPEGEALAGLNGERGYADLDRADSDLNVTAFYIPVNATSDTGGGDVPV